MTASNFNIADKTQPHYNQFNYVMTLVSKNLTTLQFALVLNELAILDVDIVDFKRLSKIEAVKNTNLFQAFEINIQNFTDSLKKLHSLCLRLSERYNFDITVQKKQTYSYHKKLVCFDMDSTLIEQEVIVELAKSAGIGEQVSVITESAMRGEIDFNESFTKRVALLKGLSVDVLDDISKKLVITEGAKELMQTLKANGYHTALLSGGFTYFAKYVQQQLDIDEIHANVLDIKDGAVTGEVCLPIVDGAKKAEILQNIATQQGIQLNQVVAVGDGANDLQMMAISSLGIAFKAKPLVKKQAQQSISNNGLGAISYILGIDDNS